MSDHDRLVLRHMPKHARERISALASGLGKTNGELVLWAVERAMEAERGISIEAPTEEQRQRVRDLAERATIATELAHAMATLASTRRVPELMRRRTNAVLYHLISDPLLAPLITAIPSMGRNKRLNQARLQQEQEQEQEPVPPSEPAPPQPPPQPQLLFEVPR